MSKIVTVKMADGLVARLDELSKKLRIPRSELVREAVARFLAEITASKQATISTTIEITCPCCGKTIKIKLNILPASNKTESHPAQ